MEKTIFANIVSEDKFIVYHDDAAYENTLDNLDQYTHVLVFKKVMYLKDSQFISFISSSVCPNTNVDYVPDLNTLFAFYDQKMNKLFICDRYGIINIEMSSENWITKLPKFFGYVISADKLTINQFKLMLQKKWEPAKVAPKVNAPKPKPENSSKKEYLHTRLSGKINVLSIKRKDGRPLEFDGKYDFVNVNDLPSNYMTNREILKLFKEKKIELVDENYYRTHKNKYVKLTNELIINKSVSKYDPAQSPIAAEMEIDGD